MLLIKTKIGPSTIPNIGMGLFADQLIPKGTVTWKYDPEFDTSFTQEQVDRMPEIAKERFLNYAYFDHDIKKYILCCDDLRFINHQAKDPNILSTPTQDIAAKDIQKGEELFCNYNHYEGDYFKRRELEEAKFI